MVIFVFCANFFFLFTIWQNVLRDFLKNQNHPMFGPKLGYFYGIFDQKVFDSTLFQMIDFSLIFWKIENHKRPVFWPKLGHFYGVFDQKVIPHNGVLGLTNKTVISDFFYSKKFITHFFQLIVLIFRRFSKKNKNPETPPVRTQIWTLLWGLRQKKSYPMTECSDRRTELSSQISDSEKFIRQFFQMVILIF